MISADRLNRTVFFHLVATAMLILFVGLASLRAWSGERDVVRFLVTMGVLFGLYGAAIALVRVGSVATVLVWAALFRLAMVPVGLPGGWTGDLGGLPADLRGETAVETFLLYDNDVWRYLWDGHLTSRGADVYGLSPAEIERCVEAEVPACEELWDTDTAQEVFDRVSYADYRTVYPPLAQGLFRLSVEVAPGSAILWRLMMIAFDFAACFLLVRLLVVLGRDPRWTLIYAWNPMVVKELSGSVHVDAALICFLLAAVYCLVARKPAKSGLFLSLALLVKPTPVWILPLFLRRMPRRFWGIFPAAAVIGFLPFIGSVGTYFRSLGRFAEDWAFNAGPWNLFLWLGRGAGLEGRAFADGLSLLITVAVVVWTTRKDDGSPDSLIRGLAVVLGTYLIFSPTVMPWYLLWVLPWAAIQRCWAWPVLTAASLLSYGIYVDGREHWQLLALEHTLFVAALLWDRRRVRTGGAPSLLGSRRRGGGG